MVFAIKAELVNQGRTNCIPSLWQINKSFSKNKAFLRQDSIDWIINTLVNQKIKSNIDSKSFQSRAFMILLPIAVLFFHFSNENNFDFSIYMTGTPCQKRKENGNGTRVCKT
jgi:hypothetical protein